jgi:acetoacetyl-CoA synthetase
MTEPVLYRPSKERVRDAQITAFLRFIAARSGRELDDTRALHAYSVAEPGAFWDALWDFTDVVGEKGSIALADGDRMPGARFFPEARLSFAENLLRRDDDAPALLAYDERGHRGTLTYRALRAEVSRAQAALRSLGVGNGDRVAAYMPNLPATVIYALAASSLGAIFSSCSPDFGASGAIDRFGQIEPKVLVVTDGYLYGGKRFDVLGKAKEVVAAIPSIAHVVVVPHLDERPSLDGFERASRHPELLDAFAPGEPSFERSPFDHPLYVLYSSGTTGKPKCIVHGAGGTLLQHLKEHRLHVDLRADERFFYFTTCGWMMWNWLVSGLATGAALVLYDGSPFAPSGDALFELVDREGIQVFGVSAKYLEAVKKAGLRPRARHELGALRAILSTGSPLAPESFDFVYEHIKPEVALMSISGGTDIVSCFVGGDPTRPVRRGEIQAPGLGMAVEVWNERGERVVGEMGELVCTRPFPSMPVGFFGDADGSRYRAAYFERFPGVWTHGDFTRETDDGGYVIAGRSDATLNPGGVRIGTAEIYRPIERMPEVLEALAIGQPWKGDVRVVLFVVLREGEALDDALAARMRASIREEASPRHVPAKILAVPALPRTRSGKISELAVLRVVQGLEVKNVAALANPESLEAFRGRPELSEHA